MVLTRAALQRDAGPGHSARVAIDAAAFVARAPGVRRYVTGLCGAIRSGLGGRIDLVGVGRHPVHVAGSPLPMVREGLSPPTNLGRCLVGLPSAVARAGVDVFHAPAYTAPLVGSTPVLLSIHDVSYARHPEWYPYRRDRLRRWFYRASARRAARIVTGSEFSRHEIVAAYRIDPERVDVVPYGVGGSFRPSASADEQRADRGRVERLLGRPVGQFLLHVGDLHARRDLPLAVRVVSALRGRGGQLAALGLVLIGSDRGALGQVRAAARAAGLADAVVSLDGIDDEDLAALYRAAAVLIYPSRYEGFGFPLVEAMACGLPVVAARAGATPEVVGDAAILVEAGAERAFAEAVDAVMTGPPERGRDLAGRGRQRAAAFTWARAAERTAEVYERCLHPTSR